MRNSRVLAHFCGKISFMRIPKFLILLTMALPLQLFAQTAGTSVSSDWGWLSLVFIGVAVVLTSIYSLSKAIETLVDRIREKSDFSDRI
ncbi:MAG: hypothetical protein RL021_935 [Bacteroidota bacterium]|jgi:hypothetical protein